MESRTFYSQSAGLAISPPGMKGKIMEVDGASTRVGEKIIQFSAMGQTKFGSYETADEQIIQYLEKRAAEVGDVFGPERFNELTIPADIRIADLQRTIQSQNALLKDQEAKIAAADARRNNQK